MAGNGSTDQKKLHAQLLASERLASMGALTASVGHEINNPLASIMVNLDLIALRIEELAADGLLPSSVVELIEPLTDAREAAKQIRDIVRDLRLFARGAEDEDLRPVDVMRVLSSTLRMARNEIKHRARLVTDYRPVPPVNANESRLAQVFLNLVINAAQSLPDGHALSNEVRIATRTEDGQAVVEVRDTGRGMTPEVTQRLFSPFFTTKHEEQGVGLGLVICHRIVTELKGVIEVESQPGKGSTFRVKLPPAADTTIAPLQTPIPIAAPKATRCGNILVIDDEPAIGRVIKRILAPQHQVTVIDDAKQALERLCSGDAYDVIFCDLMMPMMSGMEFFNRLSKSSPGSASKVVFLTAGAFTPAARAFLDAVENRCLDKPFSVEVLRSIINSSLI
jgi:nitrogen-specific signal transduction histidine kinase